MHKIKFLDGSVKEFETLIASDLRYADLRNADLEAADLRAADLRYADLRNADLRFADLRHTDLRAVNLRAADLRNADLEAADVEHANLSRADLGHANLRNANLRDANLRNANLEDVALPHFQICPQVGSFRAYKKVYSNTFVGVELVIEVEIPADAKRTSSLIGRKCRASHAITRTEDVHHYSNHSLGTIYKTGEVTRADAYDDDIRVECTHGIHFFMTREEAEEW